MTVVRLPNSELWVHSPIPLTDALAGEVQQLGRVAHLIAPNRFPLATVTPAPPHTHQKQRTP